MTVYIIIAADESTTIRSAEYPYSAPIYDAVVTLPGPKATDAMIKPGPSIPTTALILPIIDIVIRSPIAPRRSALPPRPYTGGPPPRRWARPSARSFAIPAQSIPDLRHEDRASRSESHSCPSGQEDSQ